MEYVNTPFEIKKSFGIGVLLKLTKKKVSGIEIKTQGNHYLSNVPLDELARAVDSVLEEHHIGLKVG